MKRLCALEPCLRFERVPPPAGLEPGHARSVGQHLTYCATGTPHPDRNRVVRSQNVGFVSQTGANDTKDVNPAVNW